MCEIKLLLAALIFCIGSFASHRVSKTVPPRPWYFISDAETWNTWDYVTLIAAICATGLFIAAVKIRD